MQCAICNTATTIGFCDTCKAGVCDGCSTECRKCGKRVCSKHFQVTLHGRKLCGECWKRREEKHAARKAEKAGKGEAVKEAPSRGAEPAQAFASEELEDTSFEALMGSRGNSFEALSRGGPTRGKASETRRSSESSAFPGAVGSQETSPGTHAKAVGTPQNRPKAPEDRAGIPRMHSALMRKRAEKVADEDIDDHEETDEPAVMGPTPAEVLEGGMTYDEMREKIMGLDPNRPLKARSGYDPPSRTAYLLAFLAFTVVGFFLWIRVPVIKEIIWPFDVGGIDYDSNQEAVIQDTNRLRNTSNITNLNVLVVIPLFVLGWGLLLAYVLGAGAILWGTSQSLMHYYQRWRDDKIRQAAVSDKSYPY